MAFINIAMLIMQHMYRSIYKDNKRPWLYFAFCKDVQLCHIHNVYYKNVLAYLYCSLIVSLLHISTTNDPQTISEITIANRNYI